MATINKTRPSCAKVKVLVDLLADLPKKVRMDIKNGVGEIQYDFYLNIAKRVGYKGMMRLIFGDYIQT